MPIQPGDVEYVRYRNTFLRARCNSRESVVVHWGESFTHTMSAIAWDSREFVAHPEQVRLLSGSEAEAAAEFLTRMSGVAADKTWQSVASRRKAGP